MLTRHPNGVVLAVRARPGSKKNELRGIQDGMLKVCVTQVPEQGKANQAIRKQLAKSLGLRISRIELLSGETSPRKEFLLRDVDLESIRRLIRELE